MKKTLLLLTLVLGSVAVLAEDRDYLALLLVPLDGSNDRIPSTSFSYEFNMSDSTTCTSPYFNHKTTLTTDKYGFINYTLDVSSLSQIPQYLCVYRDSVFIESLILEGHDFRKIGNTSAEIISAVQDNFVNVTGDTMTGDLTFTAGNNIRMADANYVDFQDVNAIVGESILYAGYLGFETYSSDTYNLANFYGALWFPIPADPYYYLGYDDDSSVEGVQMCAFSNNADCRLEMNDGSILARNYEFSADNNNEHWQMRTDTLSANRKNLYLQFNNSRSGLGNGGELRIGTRTGDYDVKLEKDTGARQNLNVTGNITADKYVANEGNLGFSLTDDGSNLVLTTDVTDNNYFEIGTDGAFMQVYSNPNPANGYVMVSFTETQGADTQVIIYEGGTTHNRFWDSGSMRIGGEEGHLCTDLGSHVSNFVDCNTPATGADLVLQDDLFNQGDIFTNNGSVNLTGGSVYASGNVYSGGELLKTYTNSSWDLSQIPNTGEIDINNENLTNIDCLEFKSGGLICSG